MVLGHTSTAIYQERCTCSARQLCSKVKRRMPSRFLSVQITLVLVETERLSRHNSYNPFILHRSQEKNGIYFRFCGITGPSHHVPAERRLHWSKSSRRDTSPGIKTTCPLDSRRGVSPFLFLLADIPPIQPEPESVGVSYGKWNHFFFLPGWALLGFLIHVFFVFTC
jgi:hypothetical protein